jgi:hypothetical protein
MILLADESVDLQIVKNLRQDGHEVSYVSEMEPGLTDEANQKFAKGKPRVRLKFFCCSVGFDSAMESGSGLALTYRLRYPTRVVRTKRSGALPSPGARPDLDLARNV